MPTDTDLAAILKRLALIEDRLTRLSEATRRAGDRVQNRAYAQVEALIGLYRTLDGLPTVPPLRGYALSSEAARELHLLVHQFRPAHVLELGSGASTVLFGHLAAAGVVERVTTVEHDAVYFESTRRQLVGAGLIEHVDLRLAPLVPRRFDGEVSPWYDVEPDEFEPINMLLVDGPPGNTASLARLPAVPLLGPALADDCLVIVDDYDREAEVEIVERWRREHGAELLRVHRTTDKAIAVLTQTSGPPTPDRDTTTSNATAS